MIYSLIWLLGIGGVTNVGYVLSYIIIVTRKLSVGHFTKKTKMWTNCKNQLTFGVCLHTALGRLRFKSLELFLLPNKYNINWHSKRFGWIKKWVPFKTLVKVTLLASDWNVFQTARSKPMSYFIWNCDNGCRCLYRCIMLLAFFIEHNQKQPHFCQNSGNYPPLVSLCFKYGERCATSFRG